MKKVYFIKILLIVLFIVIFFVSYVVHGNLGNLQNSQVEENSVFSNYDKELDDINLSNEKILEVKTEIPKINESSEILLECFDKKISNIEKIQTIYDSALVREVTRVTLSNYEIDIDKNGDIVSYKNFDDYSTIDKNRRDYSENESLQEIDYKILEKEDLNDIISLIENKNELNEYELIDCSNNVEGVWVLTWCKVYENKIRNPYECVNVVVDAKDGSIMLFGKNNIQPNRIEPIVKKEDAINSAKKNIPSIDIKEKEVELSFVRPNFYFTEKSPCKSANFIRLAWIVKMEDNCNVYIDAETGENIGGSSNYSTDCGRALGVVSGYGMEEKVNMAYNGLNKLGYNQKNYPPVTWGINQTDIDWLLSRPDLYGLYLCCHGLYMGDCCVISDGEDGPNRKWAVYSTSRFGNWHFVFLDACFSSRDLHFADSFGSKGTGKCFIGWAVEVDQVTSYEFCKRFWSKLGKMSIHSNVIESLWECRNAGMNEHHNICDPGFAGDQSYYGWAW